MTPFTILCSDRENYGQQCCYSNTQAGNLVKGPSGGGSADSYSPSTDYNQHLIRDLVPYILCCKVDPALPSCSDYYEARPSGSEMSYELPVPAVISSTSIK